MTTLGTPMADASGALHGTMADMIHKGHNMTGMVHNMTGMVHNMTGMVHNMTGMEHNMTGMEHNMTGMEHNMTGMKHNATDHSQHGDGMHGGSNMHGMHGGGMSGMGLHQAGEHTMKMYFHTGITEFILLEDCQTTSEGGMVAACVVVFLVAILYEGMKFFREVLLQRSLGKDPSVVNAANKHSSQNGDSYRMETGSIKSRMLQCSHVVQSFLHIIQVFISYCLMLVFMTYNAWLCLAVILGAGVGYFLFGWKRAMVADVNEHCH